MIKIRSNVNNFVTQNTKFFLPLMLIFIPNPSLSQSDHQNNLFPPLKFADYGFKKNYRVLKTTQTDINDFNQKYPNTDYTLDYILRSFFYISIHLSSSENTLISMDGSNFKLKSCKPIDITNEVITLIGGMSSGFREVQKFNKKIDD
tara:strand:+ start:147 stop:587 length:441 start_codon:yes stop_codon:yes gene_type:complete